MYATIKSSNKMTIRSGSEFVAFVNYYRIFRIWMKIAELIINVFYSIQNSKYEI